jgi:hypothetical protein
VKSRIVEATMWFVVTFALAYGAFSLVGNVLAEGQRAQVKSLSASLKVARENDQKAKIEMVAETSLASIDTWAKRRGFIAPAAASEQKVNVVAQETEYVARR